MARAVRLGEQRPHRLRGIGGAVGAEEMAMKAGVFVSPAIYNEGIGGSVSAETYARQAGVLLVEKVAEAPSVPAEETIVLTYEELHSLAENAMSEEVELATV